jgi:UDP-3-O-[3-hydroxymyristoyl] glucosamine N-acyltransferase
MEFSAEQIAGILAGEVAGNPEIKVNNLSKIEEGLPGTLSFLANPKYEEHIYTTGASVCIVNKTFEPNKKLPETLTLIKVDDAYACFAKLLDFYNQMRQKAPKIEQPSFVAESATLGENSIWVLLLTLVNTQKLGLM